MNLKLVCIKRIYDSFSEEDGCRVLVDRLWPRGITKEKARLDYWLKDIAPSSNLRKSFGHNPDMWKLFREKYWKELDDKSQAISEMHVLCENQKVTLLYSAKDIHCNNAVVLRDYLRSKI